MPYPPTGSIGQQLLDVPFPDMILSMGLAIAESQYELDMVGMRIAQMMSGEYEEEVPDEDDADPNAIKVVKRSAYVRFDGEDLSLLELGFTPTFYQYVDTLIEVKISISMSYQRKYEYRRSRRGASVIGGVFFGIGGAKATASSVSASYSSKYQYSAEGSSLLRTKLVPVPSPAVLEERIRLLLEDRKAAEAEAV